MLPQHAAAFFVLGLLPSEQRDRLEVELETKPLPLPSEESATFTVLSIYLQEIVEGAVSPAQGMAKIEQLNNRFDNRNGGFTYADPIRRPDRSVKRKLVGSKLKLEYLFTWWREYQDAVSGDMIIYYNDLPIEQAIAKFEEHIVDEAGKCLAQLLDGGPRQ